MRDGIYEVEFSDLSAGLQSKGIAIIDCFRFDAVIEGKVFWADYTQNWEVFSATLFSSRYRNELARRRIRRDWLYTTIISQIEDGLRSPEKWTETCPEKYQCAADGLPARHRDGVSRSHQILRRQTNSPVQLPWTHHEQRPHPLISLVKAIRVCMRLRGR
jgi:hypothetical protein